jgi:hypothetical protein
MGETAGDGEQPHRIEDEEGAQSEQHYREYAKHVEISFLKMKAQLRIIPPDVEEAIATGTPHAGGPGFEARPRCCPGQRV